MGLLKVWLASWLLHGGEGVVIIPKIYSDDFKARGVELLD